MAGKFDNSNNYDVAIVGGGPAGLTAAIFLARYLHSVVLVDSGDPRNWETRGIHGFLGVPQAKPADLRAKGRDEARKYGAELIDACVDRVTRRSENDFELALDSAKTVYARRVLLAIGFKDVWPSIPGLERVYGETAHVCPDCDGYEARGRKTVVIGTGRKVVGMATNLATWTREIIICTNGEPPAIDAPLCGTLDALNIPVPTSRILRVDAASGRVTCLELEGGMSLDAERISFAIGQYPADDLGAQLGCQRDDNGQIVVNEHYHTSVRNVYAAGD